MARITGTVEKEEMVVIPVMKHWIIRVKNTRYVYVDLVSPKVRKMSREMFGDVKIYSRFAQTVQRGLYNVVEIYGMKAINIDEPQDTIVSVRVKFVLSDDKDAPCEYKPIRRK